MWRKKQSDVTRFCEEGEVLAESTYSNLRLSISSGPTRPDKARGLGYKAQQVAYVFALLTKHYCWFLETYVSSSYKKETCECNDLTRSLDLHLSENIYNSCSDLIHLIQMNQIKC